MRIAFGTDETTPLTAAVVAHLEAAGHEVAVVAAGDPWPEVGRRVGEAVAATRAERGVVCCWTGTGVAIAANKVRGVRAALCTDAETARGARRWNDANVLALGLRLTSTQVAGEVLDAFLDPDLVPDPDEVVNISGVEAPSSEGAPAESGGGEGRRGGGPTRAEVPSESGGGETSPAEGG